MKAIKFICAVAVSALFSSCSCISPIAATSNEVGSKCGTSKAVTFLSIFTFNGDCSIDAAAKNAGIKKISHVDQKVTDILGIYGTKTTYVYGE